MENNAAGGAFPRRNFSVITTGNGDFRSGLSWRTIYNKRENFRAAFHDFDFRRVATFDETDVARLVKNAGIIRYRGKIEAVINNAGRACELADEAGPPAAFFWRYEEKEAAVPQTRTIAAQSLALSRDLKKRGWKFVGPTTMFAFMQAMGLINDHAEGCVTRAKVAAAPEDVHDPVGALLATPACASELRIRQFAGNRPAPEAVWRNHGSGNRHRRGRRKQRPYARRFVR